MEGSVVGKGFPRELEEDLSWGSGVRGIRVEGWLKEYSLRILTLQTADPKGKQNICARICAMLTRFRDLL